VENLREQIGFTSKAVSTRRHKKWTAGLLEPKSEMTVEAISLDK
jgi:hypothetical protein